MLSNLRSLLLAAIVLTNCITWTASRHHYSHNVAGHRSRHRRQGAGLFLSASNVIPGGEGTGWGEWGEVSPCSRTCGGGVASQKRICLQIGPDGQPACTGGDTKYFSCQTQDCPDAEDFRAQQCAEYNNATFRSIKYKWVPYTRAPNPCELNCMPHGERFYYRQKAAVVDGTRCNDESFDVCVDGTCQPVGCDMMLGSSAKEDKCRECRGNGANCHTLNGILNTQDLIKGYNDMMLIPEGATTIIIAEVRSSNNYLALRAKNGTYYLNGDYHIDFPRSIMIAGALWYYERSQQGFPAPDKLRCLGPINEPLYLSLLLQDENVGIEYEYSLPKALAPHPTQQYNWVHEEFTPCSVSCGGGIQTRNVTCRAREELTVVEEGLCDEGLKPPTSQACSSQPCAPQWVPGEWSQCSRKCKGGTRSREVRCEKVITNGFPSIVADKECFDLLGEKPELYQECNVNATCPSWFVGHWKPCDKLCDQGKQTRQVVCYQKDDKNRKTILGDEDCEAEKPASEQPCMLEPCDGVDWVVSDWDGCDSCLSVNKTRIAECATKDHEVVDSKFCDYHPKPTLTEACDPDTLPPCEVQWYATQWSKCSVDCGEGAQTRRVFCGQFNGEFVVKVDDEMCKDQPKYSTSQTCTVPLDKCPSKWYAGPWSECTKECGGGEQYRRVMCLKGGESAKDCIEKNILDSTQSCNPGPCNKDEVLPINSTSKQVMDGEEDCEEDYSEVGLEEGEDSPSIDEGSGDDIVGFGEPESELTSEIGSGLEDSLFSSSTYDIEGSGEIDISSLSTFYTTSSDSAGSSETSETAITTDLTSSSDVTESSTIKTGDNSTTTATESMIKKKTGKVVEAALVDSETTPGDGISTSIPPDTVETEETAASVSTESTNTSETGETTTSDSTESTATEETPISGSTESTGTEEIEETPTIISTVSTGSDETEETSPSGSTEISETTETAETEETPTTLSTELTEREETPTSGSTETSETPETEETPTTLSTELTESEETEETPTSGPTETSEIPETEETPTTVSTESTGTAETEETTTSGSTESTGTTETEETTTSGPTESTGTTEIEETSISGSTESTSTSETEETSTSASTESTNTVETEITSTPETTESTTTEETSKMKTTSRMITIESTSETEVSESSEPTTTELDETTTSQSTISDKTEKTIFTETTETSIEEDTTPTDLTELTTTEKTEETTQESTVSGETITTTKETSDVETTEHTSESSSTMLTTEDLSTTELTSTSVNPTDEETTSVSSEPSTISSIESEITTEPVTTETTEFSTSKTSEVSKTESAETEGSTLEVTTKTETESEETSRTTETGSAESIEGITTESLITSGSTELTSTTIPEEKEGTTVGTTESAMSTTEEPFSLGTTIWDYHTTMAGGKRKCKKKTTCATSKFGCCPDRKKAAAGPFDEGCVKPRTCKDSLYGCCPDGVSPAPSEGAEGCPVEPCADTLFGCCLSDNTTASQGNDQEGCPPPPPPCKASEFGCCEDNETEATGPDREGCPEKTTTAAETESTRTPSSETTETEVISLSESTSSTTEVTVVIVESCLDTEFGCCPDNETISEGPNYQGCPCNTTVFGCCQDGVTIALGVNFVGCPSECSLSRYGCCPDGETPAHGEDMEGCCLLYPYGCCPDNRKPADGPHLEGCGCQFAKFGCCPDNVTYAHGPDNKGCGCRYTAHGCCPDRHTEASGPEFEGCHCSTYQFGCCPDGVTVVKGPDQQGCLCAQSAFGCCGDGQTPASGPQRQGCDCATSEFGCCPDGATEATGPKFLGCTDIPVNKQAACSLPTDRGSCGNYSVYWYFDVEYGGCTRFWYGGCEGNGNRFSTKEECEDICVQPPPKDACKLPKSKGACLGYHVMWHYDAESEQCRQFVYGGCLGNSNKFDTRERCQTQCEPTRTADQCTLAIDRGSCAGNFARWGFNHESHKCEEFIWGGCEGNANRFGSEAACIQRCNPPGQQKPQCEQAQDVGNCTKKEALWSFSQTENRCVPFYYSGCGGNDNKFVSEESCAEVCPNVYVPDVCTMPAEAGECGNYRERWYFDTAQQSCRYFYYGGCGGNGNNFATRQECESRCAEQVPATTTTTVQPEPPSVSEYCFMEIDAGPCNQFETRWAYDYSVGRCTTFQYGGCGGNGNNFPAEEYCHYYCKTTQDICQLPMLSGPCDQSLMKWFYDPSSDSCSQFTYGGCEGNDNRFDTREDCERRCRTGPAPVETHQPATVASIDSRVPEENLPPECAIASALEECVRADRVWYMDTQRRECVSFENGDAGVQCMNTGVFATQETCERSCGVFRNIDVCRYEVDPGPCQDYQAKYYFNATAGICVEYAYGGCHGGPNRFSTIDECMNICRPQIDPCKLGPEQGSCNARFVQWYYNNTLDECSQFIYTGCGGNDNRFESRQDCEGQCKRTPVMTTTPTTTITTTMATTRPTTTHEPVPEECRTPESLQPCGYESTVFYYNSETRSCLAGGIGGCGYQNSYRSEEECERRCGAFRDINVCESVLDIGSCQMSIPKFYWDATSGSCQPFAYSGCGGGPNRFSSAEECRVLCEPTGPGANEVPDCSAFIKECSIAHLTCPYGVVAVREGDGCERCSCEPTPCVMFEEECVALVCSYGIERVTAPDGCPRCKCNEDPCTIARCNSTTESCVVTAYRDPVTNEPRYVAQCQPDMDNEILPDCGRYEEECQSLRCEFGVQRTRTSSGCERCACVLVEVDCAPLREECDRLRCNGGIDTTTDSNGCPRCTCADRQCNDRTCPKGDKCVVVTYRDPITTQIKYSSECRSVNKPGLCPSSDSLFTDNCREQCKEDADCRGVGKCCKKGCYSLCLAPVEETTPAPITTTTFSPDLPHAPQVNVATEPEVSAAEGGKATLRCLFHGNPPPKITWRRGEVTIDGDVGRYRLLSDGALEIVSLYRNDSGVYICVADNGLGIATQEIRLQVSDPVNAPAGIAGEQNAVITGDLNKPLLIRCLTYGYPKPAVFWYRGMNGPMIPFSSAQYETRFDLLKIRKLTYDTLGEYLCQAYNGEGKAATWLVVVRAYEPKEQGASNLYLVTKGDKVVDLTSREPKTETSTTTTTTPAPVEEPDFDSELELEIPIYTVPVSTYISNSEINLVSGKELSVTCDVNGYPEPDVYWTKNKVRLVNTEKIWITGTSVSRLTIPHVSTADSGVYACNAANAYGAHYSTVQVAVQAPSIPAKCVDNPYFANCTLIVLNRFCNHMYYSRFCCKSCMEDGQLTPEQAEMQSDQPYAKKK